MEVTQQTVSFVLTDFYNLTKELKSLNYLRDYRKVQLKEKNSVLIKSFLGSVEVCFDDPQMKKNFQAASEHFFNLLLAEPIEMADVPGAIKIVEGMLKLVEGKIIYQRFLSVLSEYSLQ